MNRLDVTLAKAGLLASVLLLSLRVLASQVLLLVIPIATAVGCLSYMGINERPVRGPDLTFISNNVIGWVPAVVLTSLAALVLLVFRLGGRTGPVFLLTGAIGSMLLLQILFVKNEGFAPAGVLLEILLVAVVIRLAALFVTPGFIGVDIWTHIPTYVSGIATSGDLSALAGSKYIMAPIYHIFGGIASVLITDPRASVYLTLGILIPLSGIFVYTTAIQFVSMRWALLATWLYVFSDQFIRWGLHIIPTSLGLVFFLFVLYVVTWMFFEGVHWPTLGLLGVVSVAMVFTHQVSTTILLVFLGITTTTSIVCDIANRGLGRFGLSTVSLGLLGVFTLTVAVTAFTWSNTPYGGTTFLWNRFDIISTALAESGFLNLAGEGVAAVNGPTEDRVAVLLPYIEQFGFAILLGAGVLGGLVMIGWRQYTKATYTHLGAAAVMFVIVFGLSLFGFRVLLPGRWVAFLYAPLAVIAAIGVSSLWSRAPRSILILAVVVLAIGYPMSMVVAPKATLDSPAFDDHHLRFSYTESELAAVYTLSSIRPPGRYPVIQTDHPYRTVFARAGGYDSRILVMNESGPVDDAGIVHRNYQRSGLAEFHSLDGSAYRGPPENFTARRVCPPTRNRIYSNDRVTACIVPGTEGRG